MTLPDCHDETDAAYETIEPATEGLVFCAGNELDGLVERLSTARGEAHSLEWVDSR